VDEPIAAVAFNQPQMKNGPVLLSRRHRMREIGSPPQRGHRMWGWSGWGQVADTAQTADS